jgi:hypothetical protein
MDLKGLRELVKRWDLENPDDSPEVASKFQSILGKLEWFGTSEWAEYLPCHHPDFSAGYLNRLANWIGNVQKPEEQQLLLEYALYIAFFSHADFCALYRTAFCGPITRWIVERARLRLDQPDFQSRLADELFQRTWYCPVTDSMDINEFYHTNHIVGVRHRPGFALLKMLDQPMEGESSNTAARLRDNLEKYRRAPNPQQAAPPLDRLVLLEDFVGSGTQASGALLWAARNLDIPILFVPLVLQALTS